MEFTVELLKLLNLWISFDKQTSGYLFDMDSIHQRSSW